MPIEVIMPQMGESIFEGTITKWLKKAGDPVAKDEPLFEISTDKVDAEIPAPVAGILTEIKFPEGATVDVNTVVAILSDNNSLIAGSDPQEKSTVPKTPETEAPKVQLAPPQVPQVVAGGIEIVMPQMGESIFEGTITKWLKKVGDPVQKDEPLFEISTDKVDAEIPSPTEGVLTEIKFPEGATVDVNTVVAVIGGSAGPIEEPEQPSRLGEVAVPASSAPAAPKAHFAAPQVPPEARLAAPQVPPKAELAAPQLPQRSSPLVRRIAKDNNVDLSRIAGTGSSGRITKEDILAHLSQSGAAGTARNAGASEPPKAQSPSLLVEQVVPMTRMRAIIAARMAESMRTIPHAHTVYKVDMTRIVRLREKERAGFEQRHGLKLTYMPFIAMAAVEALKKFPIVNASLIESSIHYHCDIHLGIAVALEWGLIVPVIRSAQSRDFVSIARAIADLATRARTKKLMPDEVGGSTFTLTNAGAFGGEYGMPIVNQPESAILAIGGLRKEPVVLTDAEGNDTIAIRSVQYFCLGFDHRLIDGADSGRFMTAFKACLEDWNAPIG
jgi:2-oxoglutarate dehydrogenase E2 component (dihydrolipoamide succinyltransferase)